MLRAGCVLWVTDGDMGWVKSIGLLKIVKVRICDSGPEKPIVSVNFMQLGFIYVNK